MTNDTDKTLSDAPNGNRISVKDITDQPFWLRWQLYIAVFFMLLISLFIIGKLLPFEPLKISDVEVEPSWACGGDEIIVTYTGELDSGLYTIDGGQGFAYWLSGSDKRPYSSIYFTLEGLEPFDEMSFEGPTRRVAPFPADNWHAGVDAIIYGKRFGFVPVEQRLHLESTDYLQVVDRYSSDCTDRQEDPSQQYEESNTN